MSVEAIENSEDLRSVLPLVESYQRFYGVTEIDSERNFSFLARLLGSNEFGKQFRWMVQGKPVAFGTVLVVPSTLSAKNYALLNDLFTATDYRGNGYARKLIEAACSWAKAHGFGSLEWMTREDNKEAQRLYDSMHAQSTSWKCYSLSLKSR